MNNYPTFIKQSYKNLKRDKSIFLLKNNILAICSVTLLFSCSPGTEIVNKEWLGQEIDFESIVQGVNTYRMIDSTGKKVGSMKFGMTYENEKLVARDTSQFDNGSVYETAEFHLDTTDFKLKEVYINLHTSQAILDIDLRMTDRVIGTYKISRDSIENVFKIDSSYNYSIFRGEIYMLLQTLHLKPGDSIPITVFVPTSMAISDSYIIYAGEEDIITPGGSYNCDVVTLKTDGKMPINKIWISKAHPRTLVKFDIPSSSLSIELVNQVMN